MSTAEAMILPPRWTPLQPKAPQIELWNAGTRFRVAPPGRRSGKTELAKRFLIMGDPENGLPGALTYDRPFSDGYFLFAAPTHDQAKNIFWNDLKALVPSEFVVKRSETARSLTLFNGVEIRVIGLDKPERAEGRPIDGMILDEYANMKPEVWTDHVRPALSTPGREGWAWLIGVPEGRNHYYELFKRAKSGTLKNWSAHHWPSSIIVSPEEIAEARAELDELTFQQEYEGSFVDFAGRAYYAFGDQNLFQGLLHDAGSPLIVCFDFNVSPGTAVICQEQTKEWYHDHHGVRLPDHVAYEFTAVLGEVYIPKHSNTERVCRKLVEDWARRHVGEVYLYGDATGGAKGTAQVAGSDWDIIEDALEPAFTQGVQNMVGRANPRERSRINAVNSRCKSAAGVTRLLLDPDLAPHTQNDLEGVRVLDGTAGELDKDSDPTLTHLTDALGYYIYDEFAVGGGAKAVVHEIY